jgi:hypothetical protein
MRRFAIDFTENTEKLTTEFTEVFHKEHKGICHRLYRLLEKLTAKVAKVCAKEHKGICHRFYQKRGYFTVNEYLL